MEDRFLGETIDFWMEMKKGIDEKNTRELLREVVDLRGKISFYESRIEQMNTLKEAK